MYLYWMQRISPVFWVIIPCEHFSIIYLSSLEFKYCVLLLHMKQSKYTQIYTSTSPYCNTFLIWPHYNLPTTIEGNHQNPIKIYSGKTYQRSRFIAFSFSSSFTGNIVGRICVCLFEGTSLHSSNHCPSFSITFKGVNINTVKNTCHHFTGFN